MPLFSGNPRFEGSWVKDHSLSLALLTLLVIQSVVVHFTYLPGWVGQQVAHGEPTALWPDYWLEYAAQWNVSVLADSAGALILVWASKFFFEKDSPEGKDPDAAE